MWSGDLAAIPAGWQLCDGNNGTPDLRDRFIIGGGGGYNLGSTGGSSNVKLGNDNLPLHSHLRNTSGINEVPIIEQVLQLGEEDHNTVALEHKKVASAPHCKVHDCRQWPRCVEDRWQMGQGHVTVTPVPIKVYTRPTLQARTGGGGEKDPKPFNIQPPFYALAFIMRMQAA